MSATLLGLLSAAQGAEYLYSRHPDLQTQGTKAKGTLVTSTRDGTDVVSIRQLCFALGCKTLYQWSHYRAIIQHPQEPLSSIVSPQTQLALTNGEVLDFDGKVISDSKEGYLIPLELAKKMVPKMKLGFIGERAAAPKPVALKPKARPNTAHLLEVLAIDPGHGGSDWGTRFDAIFEKDIALVYAMKLQIELKRAIPDLETFLTREDDRYISLADRAKMANDRGANLFLSLHINHADNMAIQGVESYILSPDATDDEARKTALLENETWLKTANIREATKEADATVSKILADMEQTKYIQDSAFMAALVQQELAPLDRNHGLKNRGVKQAMFYVLSQVAMPSVLVEMGFLSSSGDRGRLMNVAFQEEFVKGLVASIKRYREKVLLKEVSSKE